MDYFYCVKIASLVVFWFIFIFGLICAVIPKWHEKYSIYGYWGNAVGLAFTASIPALIVLFIGWSFSLI